MSIDVQKINEFLSQALKEDLGDAGDITTSALFKSSQTAKAIIKSKQSGILSGAYLLKPLFSILDPSLEISIVVTDGQALAPGAIIANLSGPIAAILAGERTALNLLQRMSGIATRTHEYSSRIKHTSARLLDTRKTTPLLRAFEKLAVVHGGGFNHRFGLFDMVLIKDTHVKAAGGVDKAIRLTRKKYPAGGAIKIEAEVQSVEEFKLAIEQKPDRIMLDNMAVQDISACVIINKNSGIIPIELEASGNITADTIAAIAETGVDFISSGSITHSVQALDIHLIIA